MSLVGYLGHHAMLLVAQRHGSWVVSIVPSIGAFGTKKTSSQTGVFQVSSQVRTMGSDSEVHVIVRNRDFVPLGSNQSV